MTLPVLILDASKSLIAVALASDHVRLTRETFFKVEVRNPNTRRAYRNGAEDFFVYLSAYLDTYPPATGHDYRLDDINALHVSGWLDAIAEPGRSFPTIKHRLAGLLVRFTALVRAHVLRVSPVTIMKGPTHSVVKGKPMTQAMCLEMLQRRAKAADIDTVICNHTLRADGITAYLIHGGTLGEIEKIRFV